jgi:hypothetical protein
MAAGATQYVPVTFAIVDNMAATWADLGGTQYITAGVAPSDGSTMGVTLTNITRTGATINAYAPFSGTVTLEIATQ